MPCVHMELAYCKHTIATIQKFGLISITMANVPVLNVDSSNKSACPEGCIEGSDGSDCEH